MSHFEQHVYDKAREGILAIKDATVADIYALSFYFSEEDDDPRKVTLTVGYNTNARWKACTPSPGQAPEWPIASSSNEAKWNFAFWLQEKGTACVIGSKRDDASARKEWIKSLGYWWTQKEQDADFDRTVELGDQLIEEFVNLCIRVAARLHNEGVINQKLGRTVPIIVHELDYNDQISQVTEAANPPGLTREFSDWISAMSK